eukprot:gene24613-10232_t
MLRASQYITEYWLVKKHFQPNLRMLLAREAHLKGGQSRSTLAEAAELEAPEEYISIGGGARGPLVRMCTLILTSKMQQWLVREKYQKEAAELEVPEVDYQELDNIKRRLKDEWQGIPTRRFTDNLRAHDELSPYDASLKMLDHLMFNRPKKYNKFGWSTANTKLLKSYSKAVRGKKGKALGASAALICQKKEVPNASPLLRLMIEEHRARMGYEMWQLEACRKEVEERNAKEAAEAVEAAAAAEEASRRLKRLQMNIQRREKSFKGLEAATGLKTPSRSLAPSRAHSQCGAYLSRPQSQSGGYLSPEYGSLIHRDGSTDLGEACFNLFSPQESIDLAEGLPRESMGLAEGEPLDAGPTLEELLDPLFGTSLRDGATPKTRGGRLRAHLTELYSSLPEFKTLGRMQDEWSLDGEALSSSLAQSSRPASCIRLSRPPSPLRRSGGGTLPSPSRQALSQSSPFTSPAGPSFSQRSTSRSTSRSTTPTKFQDPTSYLRSRSKVQFKGAKDEERSMEEEEEGGGEAVRRKERLLLSIETHSQGREVQTQDQEMQSQGNDIQMHDEVMLWQNTRRRGDAYPTQTCSHSSPQALSTELIQTGQFTAGTGRRADTDRTQTYSHSSEQALSTEPILTGQFTAGTGRRADTNWTPTCLHSSQQAQETDNTEASVVNSEVGQEETGVLSESCSDTDTAYVSTTETGTAESGYKATSSADSSTAKTGTAETCTAEIGSEATSSADSSTVETDTADKSAEEFIIELSLSPPWTTLGAQETAESSHSEHENMDMEVMQALRGVTVSPEDDSFIGLATGASETEAATAAGQGAAGRGGHECLRDPGELVAGRQLSPGAAPGLLSSSARLASSKAHSSWLQECCEAEEVDSLARALMGDVVGANAFPSPDPHHSSLDSGAIPFNNALPSPDPNDSSSLPAAGAYALSSIKPHLSSPHSTSIPTTNAAMSASESRPLNSAFESRPLNSVSESQPSPNPGGPVWRSDTSHTGLVVAKYMGRANSATPGGSSGQGGQARRLFTGLTQPLFSRNEERGVSPGFRPLISLTGFHSAPIPATSPSTTKTSRHTTALMPTPSPTSEHSAGTLPQQGPTLHGLPQSAAFPDPSPDPMAPFPSPDPTAFTKQPPESHVHPTQKPSIPFAFCGRKFANHPMVNDMESAPSVPLSMRSSSARFAMSRTSTPAPPPRPKLPPRAASALGHLTPSGQALRFVAIYAAAESGNSGPRGERPTDAGNQPLHRGDLIRSDPSRSSKLQGSRPTRRLGRQSADHAGMLFSEPADRSGLDMADGSGRSPKAGGKDSPSHLGSPPQAYASTPTRPHSVHGHRQGGQKGGFSPSPCPNPLARPQTSSPLPKFGGGACSLLASLPPSSQLTSRQSARQSLKPKLSHLSKKQITVPPSRAVEPWIPLLELEVEGSQALMEATVQHRVVAAMATRTVASARPSQANAGRSGPHPQAGAGSTSGRSSSPTLTGSSGSSPRKLSEKLRGPMAQVQSVVSV